MRKTEYTTEQIAELAARLPGSAVDVITGPVDANGDLTTASAQELRGLANRGLVEDDLHCFTPDGVAVREQLLATAQQRAAIKQANREAARARAELLSSAPRTITIRFCPVCKRDDRVTRLSANHVRHEGGRCTGTAVELTYRLSI